MIAPLLRVRDLHKAFGHNAVLRGVSLEVGRGEVVCLIGASGSGKSTLLRCVNGLEDVDAGTVFVDDIEVTALDADADAVRKRVGIVFQSYNLFPHLSVLDNVTLAPRRVRRVARSEAEASARALLARFGLVDKTDEYPDRLSGGQQQRVAIVRALAMEPELMLFDEITSALDPELVGEVLDIIRELKADGMTMVLATHEMGFAREVSSQVAFLDAGVVCELGPPEQIFGAPTQPRTQEFLSRVKHSGRI
jgi:polar amino acid transport system ATP-binding protein